MPTTQISPNQVWSVYILKIKRCNENREIKLSLQQKRRVGRTIGFVVQFISDFFVAPPDIMVGQVPLAYLVYPWTETTYTLTLLLISHYYTPGL